MSITHRMNSDENSFKKISLTNCLSFHNWSNAVLFSKAPRTHILWYFINIFRRMNEWMRERCNHHKNLINHSPHALTSTVMVWHWFDFGSLEWIKGTANYTNHWLFFCILATPRIHFVCTFRNFTHLSSLNYTARYHINTEIMIKVKGWL